jgi:hypothetical protein
MHSAVTNISQITPTYKLDDTDYHNSSVMSLTFDTVSTVYDFSSVGWFNAIAQTQNLKRTNEDHQPLTSITVVGPVP